MQATRNMPVQIELRRFTKSEIVITIHEHRLVPESKSGTSTASIHPESGMSDEERRKIAELEAEWLNDSPQPAAKSSGGIFGKGLTKMLKAPVKMVVSPVSTVAKVPHTPPLYRMTRSGTACLISE